jgi:PKD repeat protein
MTRLYIITGVLAVLLLLTVSCSGSSPAPMIPVTPDLTAEAAPTAEAGHYLWAYYQISVDPQKNTYEIVPVREVSDHWNVLKFLEKGPCTTCVTILNMVPTSNGTKLFDVQISHPFTTKNLTGFDVRGIAMFGGSFTFPVSGIVTSDRKAGEGELVNADGFTKLYNGTTAGSGPGGFQGYFKGKKTPPMAPNSILNGFKRHESPGATNTRNAFYSGSAIVNTYELDMPDGKFVFGYAVDASWAAPTTKPVTNPMTDFPPEANCQEPWKIDVTQVPIGQGLTDQGGQTVLRIDVYDHQGKASIFPPVIESPALFDGSANAIWKEDGTGFTRYEVTVSNDKIAAQGQYKCLVSVEDTANIGSPDYLDLTGYQIVLLDVGEFVVQANQPPVAAAHADLYTPNPGQQVHFTDDSTDPDGLADITKREWDFSFDPIDGFQVGSEEQNPVISFPDVKTYKVQLRVTDSDGHTDMLDTPLTIDVQGTGNTPPIAGADADNKNPQISTLVHFYDASIDPDGFADMQYFEWDTNGDGTYDKFGKDTVAIYDTGGDYLVQHRVTDTANNKDTLDEPLLIEVNGPPVAQAEADKYSVTLGEQVTLINTSIDDDGNGAIKHFYWDMDGNGDYNDAVDITDVSPVQVVFYDGGQHSIGLKVVDKWGLEDELDTPLVIDVAGFDPFCVELIDQYNSANGGFGTRTFRYYNDTISQLSALKYQDTDGPWDFTIVPPAQPAICKWILPSDPEVSTPASLWPDADIFFKEAAPVSGGSTYVPHRFDFTDAVNGDLVMEGQWQASGGEFDYGDVFQITHPICKFWTDSGDGVGSFSGVNFDISWNMEALGTGAAIFTVNGDLTVLNCMLIRHHINFVDTDYGYLSFSLLNYQWIDENGNEVAFMQATNGLDGTNYSGNNYTGTTICRALQTIS